MCFIAEETNAEGKTICPEWKLVEHFKTKNFVRGKENYF